MSVVVIRGLTGFGLGKCPELSTNGFGVRIGLGSVGKCWVPGCFEGDHSNDLGFLMVVPGGMVEWFRFGDMRAKQTRPPMELR